MFYILEWKYSLPSVSWETFEDRMLSIVILAGIPFSEYASLIKNIRNENTIDFRKFLSLKNL